MDVPVSALVKDDLQGNYLSYYERLSIDDMWFRIKVPAIKKK